MRDSLPSLVHQRMKQAAEAVKRDPLRTARYLAVGSVKMAVALPIYVFGNGEGNEANPTIDLAVVYAAAKIHLARAKAVHYRHHRRAFSKRIAPGD